jgi:hypothetical protein
MKKYQYTHPINGTSGIVTEEQYLDIRDDVALKGLAWVELLEPEKHPIPETNEPESLKKSELKQKKGHERAVMQQFEPNATK